MSYSKIKDNMRKMRKTDEDATLVPGNIYLFSKRLWFCIDTNWKLGHYPVEEVCIKAYTPLVYLNTVYRYSFFEKKDVHFYQFLAGDKVIDMSFSAFACWIDACYEQRNQDNAVGEEL